MSVNQIGVALVLLLSCAPSVAQNIKPVRIDASVGWTLSIDATEFFRDYQSILGGKASGFDAAVGFDVGMSTYQLGDVSIGVAAGYSRAIVRENYNYKPLIADTSFGPPQNVSQNMSLTVVPAMLTVDYYTPNRQFTGYVGAGAGVASVAFSWSEELTASQALGSRLSGIRYDDAQLAPAIMLRAGVSLGLDNPMLTNVRGAITIDAQYISIPFSAPLFAGAAKSFTATVPNRTFDDYSVQAGGFRLRIGFSIFIRQPAMQRSP